MLGIVFATSQEAASFLDAHAGGRFDGLEEGQHVRADDVLVTATGRGKIKATLHTERLLQQHDLDVLLHTGGATALSDDLEAGTLVGTTFVLEGDRVDLEAPTYPRMPLECPFDLPTEGTLVTQDHSTQDPEEQSYWERIADIRDTTGYAVAYVAAQHGTTCHVVKGVTGPADAENSPTDEHTAYEAIASFLEEHLETVTGDSS